MLCQCFAAVLGCKRPQMSRCSKCTALLSLVTMKHNISWTCLWERSRWCQATCKSWNCWEILRTWRNCGRHQFPPKLTQWSAVIAMVQRVPSTWSTHVGFALHVYELWQIHVYYASSTFLTYKIHCMYSLFCNCCTPHYISDGAAKMLHWRAFSTNSQ